MKKIILYTGTGIVVLLFITGALSPESEKKAIQVSEQNLNVSTSGANLIENEQIPSSDNSVSSVNIQTKTTYNVVKVVDGDTLDVSIEGKIERLRLIGIDTPETVDPRKPVQCFGIEASNKAKSVLTGKKVSLESDNTQGERDKYDRLLRYVFLEDGTNFNQLMIEQGYAHEYTYALPYKYQQQFKSAQLHAQANKIGLWNPNTCSGSAIASSTSKVETTTQPKTSEGNFWGATTTTSSQCNSNYSGCLKQNAGDYDCASGKGNGPNYTGAVQVLGYDEYGLDRDGDGWACEN